MSVWFGVVTWYALAQYGGGPLYCCDRAYEMPISEPWIAMPVETLGREWECGDEIVVWSRGEGRVLRALDAGPFGRHCVMQPGGECVPIVGDVPEPLAWWPGLSTRVMMVNRSAAKRRLSLEAGSDQSVLVD